MPSGTSLLRVGLTGGIASGKSTVARMFEELGALRVDADRIAHEMIEPSGAAHRDVVARFGKAILGADGRIDRQALGRIVFSDPAARADLEAAVHPRVIEEIDRRLRAGPGAPGCAVAVVDAALLVESGAYRGMDRLVVLRCSRETQVARLAARGIPAAEALARIEAQAPLDRKLAVADHVIDTDVPLEQTRRQVEHVWRLLLDAAGRRSD